jgi:hypothetical protein
VIFGAFGGFAEKPQNTRFFGVFSDFRGARSRHFTVLRKAKKPLKTQRGQGFCCIYCAFSG